jgi:DNA-binding XRE family transcriptional regulator
MRIKFMPSTLNLSGRQYIILPKNEYERLTRRAAVIEDTELPPLPRKLAEGNYPAVEAGRTVLARKLIKRRWAVGLTQAEVARRAGIRKETLCRIEKAKVTADTATVTKIVRILDVAERAQTAEDVDSFEK